MPVRTRATKTVVVKVDASLKPLWAKNLKELKAMTAKGAAAWHRRYQIVTAMIEHVPAMYLAGGHGTEAEFFENELHESRQTVYRNIRIVRLTTAAEIAKYSATRINQAIIYLEAKTKVRIKDKAAVDFETLRIQFKRDKKLVSETLATISRSEMLEAIAQLSVPDVAAKTTPVQKAVLGAVKRSGVTGAKASVTKTRVTLSVPIAGLAAIGRELAELKLDGPVEPPDA